MSQREREVTTSVALRLMPPLTEIKTFNTWYPGIHGVFWKDRVGLDRIKKCQFSGEFLKHYSFWRNSIYKNDQSYLNLAQSDSKLVIKIRDVMLYSSITYSYNFQQELQHNSLEFTDIRCLDSKTAAAVARAPVETSKYMYQKYFWNSQGSCFNT